MQTPDLIKQGPFKVGERFYVNPLADEVGIFDGFIERLTQPKFFGAFVVFTILLIAVLALLYQIIFWIVVSM